MCLVLCSLFLLLAKCDCITVHCLIRLKISKRDAAVVVAPDGTIYLVDVSSGRILWSFSSGSSIYSAYQALPQDAGERNKSTADGDDFYIDIGEDWELYVHGNGIEKVVG